MDRASGTGVTATLVCLGIGVAVGAVIMRRMQVKSEQCWIREIAEDKTGFDEFYRVWKVDKTKESLRRVAKGIAIAGAALVTGTIAAALDQDEQIRRDVRDIKHKLDRM